MANLNERLKRLETLRNQQKPDPDWKPFLTLIEFLDGSLYYEIPNYHCKDYVPCDKTIEELNKDFRLVIFKLGCLAEEELDERKKERSPV